MVGFKLQRGSRSEKKDMKRKTWIAVLVLLCFIAVSDVNTGILSGKPSFCLAGPIAIARIAGKEDLLNWYQSDSANGGFAVLTADLVIDGKVELGMEQGNAGRRRELNTRDFTIHIANKGRLTVDNPDLYFMGNKEIMTVESGGRLSLSQGGTYESLYSDHILVQAGGKYEISSRFHLAGGIRDENREPETSDPPGESWGEDVPAARPLLPNPDSTVPTVACAEGEPPKKEEYPAYDLVLYQADNGKYEWAEIPVQWDLSSVDFNRAGVYRVWGNYSKEALTDRNLCNPSDLRASLDVAVQSRTSMKIEAADILSADADGYAVMRIRIAGIPDNAVGLYLYYSFDQVSYEMAAWTGKDGEYTNYLEQNAASGQAYDYIVFKYNIGNRPIWFKTQLKVRDGDAVRTMTSDPVKCQVSLVPEATKPSSDSDGSSEGNRGGGGQGTSGRGGVVSGNASGGPGAGGVNGGGVNGAGGVDSAGGGEMAGDQAGMGEGSPGGAGGWGGGFGIPATGQPDSIRPDTDRSDTARVTQGDASASDHPEDGLFGERNRLGRDAYGRRGMPGDENGDNTEEAGDALQANAGKVETGPGGDGQEGGEGDGSSASGGRHRRVKRFVYVFAGSAGILLSANLGVGLLKGRRGESGVKRLVRKWRRKG